MIVKLTTAQRSALECGGLDVEDVDPDANLDALRAAWDGRNTLTVTTETADAIDSALTDLCNSEDDIAEHGKARRQRPSGDHGGTRRTHGANQPRNQSQEGGMKVHHVKKAQKANKAFGIKKGDEYYWWAFRRGGKRVSKTYPKRQQLTQSDFFISVYDLEDRIAALSEIDNTDELTAEISSIAEDVRSLGEEQTDKLENMPEGLQQGSTGELLQERADACESWADELEGIDVEEIDRDEIERKVRTRMERDLDEGEELDESEVTAEVDRLHVDELSTALQAAVDEAQGASSPS